MPWNMLVVHPNSTCDVCLDNYASGSQSPHAITCGHIFCGGCVLIISSSSPHLFTDHDISCIDTLSKPICPLCRTRFEARDIRKLHIDRGQTPRPGAPLLSMASPARPGVDIIEYSHEARKFQNDITRIVKEGAPASELRALIDQCHIWLKSQPHDQVTTFPLPFRACSDSRIDPLIESDSMKISGSVSFCCTT